MKKFIVRLLFFALISSYLLRINKLNALIPHYYQPTVKNLQKEGLLIGKSAYQLLYFGQIEESLSLAKLAISMDKSNETLWMILAEAQIANNLYPDALISLNNAQKINPKKGEIYFAKGSIYLKQSKIQEAKIAYKLGIKILPENIQAIFQLGNIFLIEKNYEKAIKEFDRVIEIKPDFWQAINNKGLAYFELDRIDLSIISFKKAIDLEENAEPLLGLAACLKSQNIDEAILLTKKALIKEPKYVEYNYRKEQLWGDKLQRNTEELFENTQLQKEIQLAKTKINKTS